MESRVFDSPRELENWFEKSASLQNWGQDYSV